MLAILFRTRGRNLLSVVHALGVLLVAGISLVTTPLSLASAQNLQILGASGSQYYANESPQGETDSRIRIALSVKNTSASSVGLYAGLMESCGPFAFSDGGCPGTVGVVTVGAGQTGTVYVDLVGSGSGGDAYLGFGVFSVSVGGYSATTILHIVAGSWGYPLTVTIASTTYTPQVYPKGGTLTWAALTSGGTSFAVQNVGSTAATYKLKQICGSWTPSCTIGDTLLYVPSGETRYPYIGFQAGAVGTSGIVKLIATAPAEPGGLIKADTGSLTVTSVDVQQPTISFSPAGFLPENSEYEEYWTFNRYIWIYVDVCDPDGAIAAPSMSFNNNAISYSSIQNVTIAGCASAKRASYYVLLQSIPGQQYANTATITVSDGVHTVTKTQLFRYDDSIDHRPTISVVHPTIQVQANQTQVDTFRVTNPGWHTATYNLGAWCHHDVAGSCTATAGSATISVAAGATASFPVTYPSYSTVGHVTTVGPYVLYIGPMYSYTYTDSMKATSALVHPPTASITPSSGTTLTATAISVNVSWCDSDDALPGHTVTLDGQALSANFTSGSQSGCVAAGTSAWSNITVGPGTHTIVAQATDASGHVTTVTSSITTQLPPLTDYAPLLTPHSLARGVANGKTQTLAFAVKNNGSRNAQYQLTGSCGSFSSCQVSPATLTLAPGATDSARVTFATPATLAVSSTVRAIATYTDAASHAIADTGTVTATTSTVQQMYQVQVSPATLAATAPGGSVTAYSFTVTNMGNAPAQYAVFSWATYGVTIPDGYQVEADIVLAPGESHTYSVWGKYPLTERQTGHLWLDAAAIVDGNWVLVDGKYMSLTALATPRTVTVRPVSPTSFNLEPGVSTVGTWFNVTNPTGQSRSYTLETTCTGVATTCRFSETGGAVAQQTVTIGAGVQYIASVYFTASTATTGSVRLLAYETSATSNRDSTTLTIGSGSPTISATVTPGSATLSQPRNSSLPQNFTITNTGSAADFAYTVSCTGALSCSTTSGTLSLGPGASTTVTKTYQTPDAAPATGTIAFELRNGSPAVVVATGVVIVSTVVMDNVTVDTRSLNPGIHPSRGGCLTIAAGDGAAYECGDLRIVHALPTTTTMNKARTPALIYNSAHARTRQVLAANVSVQQNIHPTALRANLSITGVANPIVRDTLWQPSWNDGVTRRIAVVFDAQSLSLATGAYHYELEILALDGTTVIDRGKDTATMIVVNRAATGSNYFGRGWWLDGLEKLVFTPTPNSNQILWVGGDGSARLYTKVSGVSKWAVTPMVDGPDTLVQAGSGYKRLLPNGAFVEFDGSGNHVATQNRQGHRTSFGYDGSNRLSTISLPIPTSGTARQYAFAYSGNYLSTVTAPTVPGVSRVTTVNYVSGTDRVSSITDPDTRSIVYGTDASTGNITSRTDKRSFVTSFTYDEAGKVRQSSLAMQGSGADVVTTFCAAESRGYAGCPKTLNLSSVYTLLDGPRTDTGDTTKFMINRFGAPDTVVNALGYKTSIGRDATFPMLAASVRQPNGFTTQATYNTRGLIETQTALAPFGGSDNALTRYFWNGVWDQLDSLSGPTGEKTRFHYNTLGDRDWQEDGRGDSTRVYFTYNSNRQLEYIQPPGNSSSQRQHLEYDTGLGNIRQTTSPAGSIAKFFIDAIGRVDSTESPIDGTLKRGHRVQFDVMDRVQTERDIGPAVTYSVPNAPEPTTAPAVTLVVTTTYDNEGNPLSVVRHSEPNIALPTDLSTTWTYDGAGRKKTETGSSGTLQWSYDAAGNVTTATTKRNYGIVTTYDALNRPLRRITPQVTRDSIRGFEWTAQCIKTPWFPHFNTGFELDWTGQMCTPVALPHAYVIGQDTATFDYDVAGNMITANNADALISRDYFASGALKTEIMRVSLLDTAGVAPSNRFNSHRYRLDYTYDLSGHRLTRRDTIPTCLGCVQTYTYIPATGALNTTTDAGAGVSSAQFGILYDAASRIFKRTVNGVRSAQHQYDVDSRMDHRTVYDASNGTTIVYDDGLDYDQAGRIISTTISSDLPGIADATTQVYNGLGALAAITRTMGSGLVDEYQTDAMGNRVKHHRWVSGERTTHNYSYGLEQLAQVSQAQTWSTGQEIPPTALQTIDTVYTNYVAGSVDNTFRGLAVLDQTGAPHWTPSVNGHEWTFNAYGADDRLKVTQRSYIDATGLRTVFSEYRYDALGRRITNRTRWDSGCIQPQPACVSTLERTIWDGDQILMELRTGAYGDAEYANGAFYGTVRYTHAGGIDEPLAVWKLGVGGTVPHLSWRGTYEAGTPLNGSTNVSWPARGRDAFFASDIRVTPIEPSQWMGSLMDGKAEPSGLIYMRNRYYDPKMGRFTQEDPIGLAGGSNLYGFAQGDPVNLSDPFGLAVCLPWSDSNSPDCRIGSHLIERCRDEGVCPFAKGNPFEWASPGGRGLVSAVRSAITVGRRGATMVRHAQNLRGLLMHITPSDLRGAARELRGMASGGEHLQEVREAVGGLREFVKDMNQALANPNLTVAERGIFGKLLGLASKGLDAAEATLARKP